METKTTGIFTAFRIFSCLLFLSLSGIGYSTVYISSCGVLDKANETYILTKDVSSAGTGFTISADHIVLDLNGFTVTYGTSAGERRYGIAIPPAYVNRTLFPDPLIPDRAFKGAKFFTVLNGAIVQGKGDGKNSHGVFGLEGGHSTVHDVECVVHGDDTDNILFHWSGGIDIYSNNLTNLSTVVTDRHEGKEVIGVLYDGGNTKIHANIIDGGPQNGIRIIQKDDFCTGFEVFANRISQNAYVANPYGISAGANNAKIYNNVISPQNGRGIHIIADNVDVFDNVLFVQEGANPEVSPGWTHGIKLEECKGAKVYGNTVTAIASLEYGDAYALDITYTKGDNSKNKVYDNTFTSISKCAQRKACAVHLIGVYPGNGIDISNNIFESNNNHVFIDWDSGSEVLFRSNTFRQVSQPVQYHTIRFDSGNIPSENLVFFDSRLENGVNFDDLIYRQSGAPFSYEVVQILNLFVKDNKGYPIKDVQVWVWDNKEKLVAEGLTDKSGEIKFDLVTTIYKGPPFLKKNFMPHTVFVSKRGYNSHLNLVTLNRSETLCIVLEHNDMTSGKKDF